MVKISYRDGDLKVEDYIRKNFKVGDLITISGIRKSVGVTEYTARMSLKWLVNFGKVKELPFKDWIRVRKKGARTKTFKIMGKI